MKLSQLYKQYKKVKKGIKKPTNKVQSKKTNIPRNKTGLWNKQLDRVIVPSNRITMKGPNGEKDFFKRPVLGKGLQTGKTIVMQPGKEYKFPGDKEVLETRMQKGGLSRRQIYQDVSAEVDRQTEALNTPEYKKLLQTEFYGPDSEQMPVQDMIDARRLNLDQLRVDVPYMSFMNFGPSTHAKYKPGDHSILLKKGKYNPSFFRHELSHSLDSSFTPGANKVGDYFTQVLSQDLNRPDNASNKNKEYEYLSDPSEVKARLKALRDSSIDQGYQLLQPGYDINTYKEGFSPGDKAQYQQLQDIGLSDDDINKYMYLFAKEDIAKQKIAQDGAEIPVEIDALYSRYQKDTKQYMQEGGETLKRKDLNDPITLEEFKSVFESLPGYNYGYESNYDADPKIKGVQQGPLTSKRSNTLDSTPSDQELLNQYKNNTLGSFPLFEGEGIYQGYSPNRIWTGLPFLGNYGWDGKEVSDESFLKDNPRYLYFLSPKKQNLKDRENIKNQWKDSQLPILWSKADKALDEVVKNPEIVEYLKSKGIDSKKFATYRHNSKTNAYANQLLEAILTKRVLDETGSAGIPSSNQYPSVVIQDPSQYNLIGYLPAELDSFKNSREDWMENKNIRESLYRKAGIPSEEWDNILIHTSAFPINQYQPREYQSGGSVETSTEENPERMNPIEINVQRRPWWKRTLRKIGVEVDPQYRDPNGFAGQMARRLADATGGENWYKTGNDIAGSFAQILTSPLTVPQLGMMYGLTGKVQTPSEAMDIQNPYGAFAVDAVLDPANIVGAGAVKAIGPSSLKNMVKSSPKGFIKGFKDRELYSLKAKDMLNSSQQPLKLEAPALYYRAAAKNKINKNLTEPINTVGKEWEKPENLNFFGTNLDRAKEYLDPAWTGSNDNTIIQSYMNYKKPYRVGENEVWTNKRINDLKGQGYDVIYVDPKNTRNIRDAREVIPLDKDIIQNAATVPGFPKYPVSSAKTTNPFQKFDDLASTNIEDSYHAAVGSPSYPDDITRAIDDWQEFNFVSPELQGAFDHSLQNDLILTRRLKTPLELGPDGRVLNTTNKPMSFAAGEGNPVFGDNRVFLMAPKGTKAAPISRAASSVARQRERELLFPADSKFKVVHTRNNPQTGSQDYIIELDQMQMGGMTVPGVNGTVVASSLYDKKKQYKSGGQHGGLDRWFAEKWVDVKTGKQCGRQEGENRAYPACRPSKRVSSKTPKTSSELSSKEKAKFKAAKTSSTRIPYNHKRKK